MDPGRQPVSNHFLKAREEREETYPIVINQCENCGLIQINDPIPADQLRPPYDWITYNEPEAHLDRLVEIIKGLPGITPESTLCGISFKDDSTLTRFNKSGFTKTRRLRLQDDFNIEIKGAGVETIQACLTPARASKIAEKFGRFDVVIVRHILEHVHDTGEFIEALKILTAKEGYIIFEVPDCSRALETCDYTTIWEEHTLYFTPATFQNSLNLAGLMLKRFECYPYPFENSLVGIVQTNQETKSLPVSQEVLNQEFNRARQFAAQLPKKAKALQKFFQEYRSQGKIALFGAGHLACTFVSVLGLKNCIDFFIDDNPHKRGLLMPGCHLPIYESAALYRENVSLCLLSLNPLSEEKVLQAHKDWSGTFFSIFPSSSIALRLPELLGEIDMLSKEFNKEVSHTTENVVKICKADIEVLKKQALKNERKRIRLCSHRDIHDTLHEMLIIHTKDAYIRPHKHFNKSESLHVVEGEADIILFDEQGNIKEVVAMGEHSSGRKVYYRLSTPQYHTLIIRSNFLVFHETTNGPFQKLDTVFAPWAPEESNLQACDEYMQRLKEILIRELNEPWVSF